MISRNELRDGLNEYFGDSGAINRWLNKLSPDIFSEMTHMITSLPYEVTDVVGNLEEKIFKTFGKYHLEKTTEYMYNPTKCTTDPYVYYNVGRRDGDIPAMAEVLRGRTDHFDEIYQELLNYYHSINHPTLCPDYVFDNLRYIVSSIGELK